MKVRLSLLATLAVLAAGANAQVVIYDTLTDSGYIGTTDVPRSHTADGFSTLPAPAGMWWRVTYFSIVFSAYEPGTYNNITYNLKFFNDWNPAAPSGSVFSGLASDTTWTKPSFESATSTAWQANLDFKAAGLAFDLVDGQSMGFSAVWMTDGVVDQRFSSVVYPLAPYIGTSPDGWYRDSNADGIIESSEGVDLHQARNLAIRIHAEAVPEPATMLILGAGAAALAARRRKR